MIGSKRLTSQLLSIFLVFLLLGRTFGQNVNRALSQRQPTPGNQPQQPSIGSSDCSQNKVTQCFAHLMALNITAVVETFKVYELMSFTDVNESKLRQQAQITTETCKAFNTFNECTGGDFLKCLDKKKFVEIIQSVASFSQGRASTGSQVNSMMNDIAALITDKQIEVVGRAMIDACRKIVRGEVKLAELAMCIRKDQKLLDQLGSIAPLPSSSTPSVSAKPQLSFGQHCRVFRCDVSRLLVHMLVRASQNCSDESGSKFIFWIGQVSMSGLRNAAPDDVVLANGEFGTQTQSESGDQCVIRDTDFNTMKRTPAKTFADIGITRASQLCAAEIATTPRTTPPAVIRYDADRPRQNNKIAIEATLDDLHNDEFWENSAKPQHDKFFIHCILSLVVIALLL